MNICVYGASSDNLDREYFDHAYELGRIIAEAGHSLVFGGGKGGLMGACARGASSLGGEIIGIAPRFFDEPGVLYEHCSRFIYTDTMRERKQAMEELAHAFVVLPGGIGTFEEFFEMLTLKQLGRHSKPMAMLNTLDYYGALSALLGDVADRGFMSRACLGLFALCDSPAKALDHCMHGEDLRGSIRRLSDYNK